MGLNYMIVLSLLSHFLFCFSMFYYVQGKLIKIAKDEMRKIVETFSEEREKSIKQYQELLTNPIVYMDIPISEEQVISEDFSYNVNDQKKKMFH